MSQDENTNPSLWWRLTWQLSLVFIGTVATVIVGLCVYGTMILSPNNSLQGRLADTLAEALVRDGSGMLQLVETPRLQAFKAENDRLWFVVAVPDGDNIEYGAIPPDFAGLGPFVHLVKEADIREKRDSLITAAIDSIDTPVGEIRVMYGGNTSRPATFFAMLLGTYPIYIPLLAVTLPALGLAVPNRLVIVSSPDIERPTGNTPVCVVLRGTAEQAGTWAMMDQTGRSTIAVDPVLRLSSLVMVRDAVRMGVGAARLLLSLVSHDLAAGTMVKWRDADVPVIGLWALYPSRRLLSARVSAFLDYLKDAFPKGTPDELAAYVGQ